MAQQALIGVVTGAQSVRIGVELREYRVKLAEPGDRRAVWNIRAGIAR
jgi:hypothetical protein